MVGQMLHSCHVDDHCINNFATRRTFNMDRTPQKAFIPKIRFFWLMCWQSISVQQKCSHVPGDLTKISSYSSHGPYKLMMRNIQSFVMFTRKLLTLSAAFWLSAGVAQLIYQSLFGEHTPYAT